VTFESFEAELHAVLGPLGLIRDKAVFSSAKTDESRTGTFLPELMLRPASVQELSSTLQICSKHDRAVVPQAGMTGLAGGANPRANEVALSLSRFAGVENVDPLSGTMLVRAGTTLQAAQREAEQIGMVFPVDLGSRGSCQIGGILATNAGGPRVIRYGNMRSNVLGLEAVLADGSVLTHLNGMVKDNTGYDLSNLFVGSEGTLAIISRAVFRLWPKPIEIYSVLCALPDASSSVEFLAFARSRVTLSAFEAMWPDYFDLNCSLEGQRFFDHTPAMVVLIEAEQPIEDFLEQAFNAGLISDAILSRSLQETERFWAVRDGHRMEQALPGLLNYDVSLNVRHASAFVESAKSALRSLHPSGKFLFFGHLGDGNLHVVIHIFDTNVASKNSVDATIYGLVQEQGGSISAEHGIGTLKREWLHYSRTPQELAAMRSIKAALDPRGILNPGKLL
jgi:FAD/FMN-containing dehydrogenase